MTIPAVRYRIKKKVRRVRVRIEGSERVLEVQGDDVHAAVRAHAEATAPALVGKVRVVLDTVRVSDGRGGVVERGGPGYVRQRLVEQLARGAVVSEV